MRLGLIADTHDRLPAITALVALFQQREVSMVLHAGDYHWPTFNIADASITVGALLLAYDLIFSRRSTRMNADLKDVS